ncbi:hypothetical protein E7811_06990 [Aliigemmobacter aestuarii]|uniref:Uncharacterized protein n=1 Tax=Aliigemmobacter aestuarii TaxID=1445661 RepID=A0A4S3MU38_9RHOB|nr:hypothetical protein [Gemmobacter aestuarii]THD85435.1 hypothetical protein E7811_06990 [Gemmobacter aestuarii]
MNRVREPEVLLSEAVTRARRFYLRLVDPEGDLPDDLALSRSRDYHHLLLAGRQIRALGTREAFRHTLNNLFSDDPGLSQRAARDLEHLWAGMMDWPDPDRPVLLN